MNSTIRKSILISLDIVLVFSSFFVSYLIRFDGNINALFLNQFKSNVIYIIAIYILNTLIFGLYRKMWRYASIQELLGIFWSVVVSMLLSYVVFWGLGINIPRSVLLLTGLFTVFFIGGTRFTYRLLRENLALRNQSTKKNKKRTLIIGAGDAGANLIKELLHNDQSCFEPVCILDDAHWKQDTSVHNIPIKGQISQLEKICELEEIQQIIIAIPSSTKTRLKEIVEIAQKAGVPVKTLPNITEMLVDSGELNQIRNIEITDLLGREEVKLDVSGIRKFVEDKVVLVTGGGGSIGSEICRQLAIYKPSKLVVLDNYENNVYDLQQELKYSHKELNLDIVIANVREMGRLEEVYSIYKPQIVFHAAAHKHVPFMEDHPFEAVKNNIFGTLNVARCADKYEVKRFVLISTDKAVNPTNIMGATKRMAELIIQNMNKISETEFAAVRFGNVLGSNGSVIPLFKKQIEHGGPVTLTHPDITRYFMSIPEASRLVIQAGAITKGGEIFVLDMGEPVKIMNLAKQLIQLSGYEPDVDIKIEVVGLRPGEKLYEELLLEEEGLESSQQDGIFISKVMPNTSDEFFKEIEMLTTDDFMQTLIKYVPSIRK